MRTVILILLVFYSLLSCKGQRLEVRLQIFNRASIPIDSISIPLSNLRISEKINSEQTKIIEINRIIDFNGKTPLVMYLSQKGKFFTAEWGFCDYGECSVFNKSIYLFDHGISYTDAPPKMPEEFILYLANMTKNNIDSIYSESGAIVRTTDISKNTKKIVFRFSKFKENPTLVVQSGKKFIADINFFDWNNWNNNQATVFLYEEGILNREKQLSK